MRPTPIQLARAFGQVYQAAPHTVRVDMVRELEPCKDKLLLMLCAFAFVSEELIEEREAHERASRPAQPDDGAIDRILGAIDLPE